MNITVYMGSNPGKNPKYREAAEQLGRIIGMNKHTLVYGGSDAGLMGAVADSVLSAGGGAIGVFPRSLEGVEGKHPGLDKMIYTDSIVQRRAKMIALGDVFVALPGGPGTMEEISEVISLARLDRLKGLCTLLNVDSYYEPLKTQFDNMCDEGFITAEERSRILFFDTVEEISKLL